MLYIASKKNEITKILIQAKTSKKWEILEKVGKVASLALHSTRVAGPAVRTPQIRCRKILHRLWYI